MRKQVIAANWKMNMGQQKTQEFLEQYIHINNTSGVDVIICPPFTSLQTAKNILSGTGIKLGAQNMHFIKSGAYTGEVSACMLKEIGVEYVIIGHSERRQYFNETDETVNEKVLFALENGLKPILCVGESLAQRENGDAFLVTSEQIKKAFLKVDPKELENIIIAYEPIWAIGTGKTATSQQANDVIKNIRNTIEKLYNNAIAQNMTIQYGGSMNENNVKELMDQPDIDGGLIGSASLDVNKFSKVVNYK